MKTYFDSLETRSAEEREAAQFALLPSQIGYAKKASTAFAQLLGDVDPDHVRDRSALSRLPVTRKSDLQQRQQAARASGGDVFGGFSTVGFGPHMPRVFASPGPIYEPEGQPRITGAWRGPCSPPVFGRAS